MASVGAAWRTLGLRPEMLAHRRPAQWGVHEMDDVPQPTALNAASLVLASAATSNAHSSSLLNHFTDSALPVLAEAGQGYSQSTGNSSTESAPPSRPPVVLSGTSFVRDAPASDSYSALQDAE